jgi:hypothetical protein
MNKIVGFVLIIGCLVMVSCNQNQDKKDCGSCPKKECKP